MNTIQSIGVLSAAKMIGAIYAILGVLAIPIFLFISLAGSMIPNQTGTNPFAGVVGIIFGLMAPVFYGAFGFIFGALGAFLYNLLAKWLGGIEVRIQPAAAQ